MLCHGPFIARLAQLLIPLCPVLPLAILVLSLPSLITEQDNAGKKKQTQTQQMNQPEESVSNRSNASRISCFCSSVNSLVALGFGFEAAPAAIAFFAGAAA